MTKHLSKYQEFKDNLKILIDIFQMIKEQKKWWLLPIFMVLAFFALFIALAGGSSVLPAIYALF